MNRSLHSTYLNIVRTTAQVALGRRAAEAWLTEPNGRLGGVAPLLLAGDRRGAERVIAELDRVGGEKGRQ